MRREREQLKTGGAGLGKLLSILTRNSSNLHMHDGMPGPKSLLLLMFVFLLFVIIIIIIDVTQQQQLQTFFVCSFSIVGRVRAECVCE